MSRLEGFVRDGASQHMWMVASRIHECLTYITVEGVMSHIEAVVSQIEGVMRQILRMSSHVTFRKNHVTQDMWMAALGASACVE